MPLILSSTIFSWIHDHLLACPVKKGLGIDCPGCGLQRSLIALLQGEFTASFRLYPASLPILVLLVFVPLHLKYDFSRGAWFIKVLYTGIAIIIFLNYFYKIYSHKLN